MSELPLSQEETYEEKFMRRAVELSEEGSSSGLGTPYGAVIVRDGKIIGESANRCLVDFDPTSHAEVSAIREACKELKTLDLTGCHIYTSCYPCNMCMAAIYWARIEAIYYATTLEENPPYHIYGFDEMKALEDDALKPNKERTIPLERVQSQTDAAIKIGKEWLLKNGQAWKI